MTAFAVPDAAADDDLPRTLHTSPRSRMPDFALHHHAGPFLFMMLTELEPASIVEVGPAGDGLAKDGLAPLIQDLIEAERLACRLYRTDRADSLPPQTRLPASLVIIDRRQAHPGLDLLELLPVLAPQAWIVLDGIDPSATGAGSGSFGAYRLFAQWPGLRCTGMDGGNIAAIRLHRSSVADIGSVLDILSSAWEAPPDQGRLDRILGSLPG